jgi:hypothetical protein
MRAAAPQAWEQVIPVVISIANDPELDQTWDYFRVGPHLFARELLSPLRGLLKTREARGALSRNQLRDFAAREEQGVFLWARPWPDVQPTPPLGWTLTPWTKGVMLRQLLGMLIILQKERDNQEPRINYIPSVLTGLPDCLRPHVPIRLLDQVCSMNANVKRGVLRFLLGSSDVRDGLLTRAECEEAMREALANMPDEEERNRLLSAVGSLCGVLKERRQ